MAEVTVGAIVNAVAAFVGTTPGIRRTQSYNQLTEGMNVRNTLQVYPVSWEVSTGSETDRISFTETATGVPGHRDTEMILFLDLYVRQRSQIQIDWGDAVDLADALNTQLDTAGACPLFGLSEGGYPVVGSFKWTAERGVLPYAQVEYIGFRFTLTLRIH